ncbi:MAG: fumarylacetoacetate hydrolase family protein [Actinomycetota bacterium]|nr:fumarylacetoacetate hydrolase family protein [Actinomycetota bacterium]
MRIYRYREVLQPGMAVGSRAARLAVAVADGPVVRLDEVLERSDRSGEVPPSVSTSLAEFVEAGPELWSFAHQIVEGAGSDPELSVDLGDPRIELLSPLDRCASLRDFLAFEDHVQNGARRRGGEVPDYWYEAPVYYKGNHRQWVDPEAQCPWPPYTDFFDFELELAMIVGRPGSDIPKETAAEHIFGFTILNDFSARDVQMKEVTAWLGPAKGKDFANALGPCIVTADEIGTEPDLEMICRVNGEEWGRGRSGSKHWSWSDMIAYVSISEDIYPTDVYGSGTPGGCCGLDLGRKLEPGDLVELEIERIGTLRNVVGLRP